MNNAAAIRTALKAAGYSSKSVSVRAGRKTGSVTVEIKDASIVKSKIAEIAGQFEKIDRDSKTGEILSGGNRFVFIGYAREALAVAAAKLTEHLKAGDRRFGSILVDSDQGNHCLHIWKVWVMNNGVGHCIQQISPNDGEALATVLAERGELQGV